MVQVLGRQEASALLQGYLDDAADGILLPLEASLAEVAQPKVLSKHNSDVMHILDK